MTEVVRTIMIDSRFLGATRARQRRLRRGGRRGGGGKRGDGHPARSHPPRYPPRADRERRRGAAGGRRGRSLPPGGAPARGEAARRGGRGRPRPSPAAPRRIAQPRPPQPHVTPAARPTSTRNASCAASCASREAGSGSSRVPPPNRDWSPRTGRCIRGLGDASGAVPDEFLWGALDCPGAYAVGTADLRLGRMTARVSGRVRPGERCTVAGWRLGRERRKHFTGTAVYGEAGNLVALASSVWIAPREGRPGG